MHDAELLSYFSLPGKLQYISYKPHSTLSQFRQYKSTSSVESMSYHQQTWQYIPSVVLGMLFMFELMKDIADISTIRCFLFSLASISTKSHSQDFIFLFHFK